MKTLSYESLPPKKRYGRDCNNQQTAANNTASEVNVKHDPDGPALGVKVKREREDGPLEASTFEKKQKKQASKVHVEHDPDRPALGGQVQRNFQIKYDPHRRYEIESGLWACPQIAPGEWDFPPDGGFNR